MIKRRRESEIAETSQLGNVLPKGISESLDVEYTNEGKTPSTLSASTATEAPTPKAHSTNGDSIHDTPTSEAARRVSLRYRTKLELLLAEDEKASVAASSSGDIARPSTRRSTIPPAS